MVSKAAWRDVRVDGAPMRLLEVGGGDPVLFLPGWGLTPRAYRPALSRLARAGVRVLAPALPPERSLDDYAARAAGLLDALALEHPAFVIGHSLGGGVAIRLACDRPDLVRSLTLLNTVGGAPGPGGAAITRRAWWRWALGAAAEVDPTLVLRPRKLAGAAYGVARDMLPNLLRDPATAVRTAALALGADLAPDARGLVEAGLPVLFVWSDRDRLMTPGAFAEIENAMPASVVSGRHGWLLTDPAEFGRLLRDALVVHAMLERSRRGEPVGVPQRESLAGYLPAERRSRARGVGA